MSVSVTKLFEFEAAHFLPNYDGLCKHLHGHSYKLEIEIEGEVDDSGFVLDFKNVKNIGKEFIDYLDHSLLNEKLNYIPTAENMVVDFATYIRNKDINIVRVRLWETSTSYAEWRK